MRRFLLVFVSLTLVSSAILTRQSFSIEGDNANQITPRTIEWVMSNDDSGSNAILRGYSGQKVEANFNVFNREKRTREFVFSYEIPDIGNGDFITAEDRKSVGFSLGRITLKPGERKTISILVTIPKNHCSSILFVVNAMSGMEKGSISLYLCQYDSENDMNNRARPAKYGNYPTLAWNKTRVGRVFRLFGSIFATYSNRFLFCYDEKTQNLKWFVESGEFHDIGIFKNEIYTDGFCLETKTGKNKYKSGDYSSFGSFYDGLRHLYEGKTFLVFGDLSVGVDGGLCSVVCMDQANGKGLWITPSYDSFWGFGTSFTMPKVPGKIFYYLNAYEFFDDELACIDTNTGKYLFHILSSSRYIQKHDQALLITTSFSGIDKSNEHIDIWDCQTNNYIYHHEAVGELMFADDGRVFYFADYKSTGAYDYISRKLLWKSPGDGAILTNPLLDPSGRYIYILDEDSVWKRDGGDSYTQVKPPGLLRLFKMDVLTGKSVWKSYLCSIPKGSDGYSNRLNVLEYSNGVVKASIDTDYYNGNKPKLVFRINASTGKPAK